MKINGQNIFEGQNVILSFQLLFLVGFFFVKLDCKFTSFLIYFFLVQIITNWDYTKFEKYFQHLAFLVFVISYHFLIFLPFKRRSPLLRRRAPGCPALSAAQRAGAHPSGKSASAVAQRHRLRALLAARGAPA